MTTLTEEQKEHLLSLLETVILSKEDISNLERDGVIEPITSFTEEDMEQWDNGEIEVVRLTVQ
jgi:hypothetical protein